MCGYMKSSNKRQSFLPTPSERAMPKKYSQWAPGIEHSSVKGSIKDRIFLEERQ